MKLVQFLKQNGFQNVKSVAGGIHAWADAFDPAMPKV
jgi:rhodanese-related sulfurtransferase